MDSEKDLINRIKALKEIKPDNEWAVLCKARIIGKTPERKLSVFGWLGGISFQYRMALAGLLLFAGAGGGVFSMAQNSLPGDALYSFKKIGERGIALITGNAGNPEANLLLAAKRLEEIDIISQKNLIKNLPAAFYEYKTAKTAAKKEVAELVQKNPQKAGEIVKEAGLAMKNIGDKEKEVYAVLGLEPEVDMVQEIAEADFDKTIIGSLIDYFKDGTAMTDEQAADLQTVKEIYANGEYSRAIEYYLNSSLNK